MQIAMHWASLRAVRKGAPLLRRLIVEPWTATASRTDKNDEDAHASYMVSSFKAFDSGTKLKLGTYPGTK